MPIYEYRCAKCATSIEVMQKMSDPAPDKCASCGSGPMEKQLSMTSFALKGSGWYVTDFKGGSPKKESSGEISSSASDAPAATAPATTTTAKDS